MAQSDDRFMRETRVTLLQFLQYVVLVVFRSVTFVFLILDFNTFYFFMEDLPENHVFT